MNARQARFVAEYLIDLNAAAAYRRVYPAAKARTAEANGHRLLQLPHVAAAVADARAKRADATEITATWVLLRLRDEAEGKGEGSTHAGRVRALELLGRHLGMFVDRVELSSRVTLEVVEEIVDAPPPAG